MSEFQIVLFNTIKDGFSKDDVKTNLAKYFNIDTEKAEVLLQRPKSVIKKGVNSESASKYKIVLDRCGIDYEIKATALQLQDGVSHQRELNSEHGSYPVKVHGKNEEIKPTKLYTPRQVIIGTFLGGPVAATYFIKQNYDAVSDASLSSKTIAIGGIFSLALLLVLPFIPEWVPGVAVYMPYFVFVAIFANKKLLSKDAIINSDEYEPQSSIKTFFFAVLIMAFYMVMIVGYMLGLKAAGIITI